MWMFVWSEKILEKKYLCHDSSRLWVYLELFVLICTVVVLYCFVMCVCMCRFCNVYVCVGFVMFGYFGNMYTVH
jgi:hypothetical protein